MRKLGESLSLQRKRKRITQDKASIDLAIKKDHLIALEEENWEELPEPTFVKGYVKNYSEYLGLDPEYMLALFRREFDESKFPKKHGHLQEKRLFLTPGKFINFIFIVAILTFVTYITIQYLSILSSPKLDLTSPKSDDITSAPATQIIGKTEKDATVSVNGKFIPVDESGNFSYEYVLQEGKNTIEVIASFRLSPKSKITRTIRLIH